MTEEHNGWTNRETWLVNLWLANDEYLYATVPAIIERSASDLAAGEAICEWLHEFMTENGASGIASDLLRQSLARVDWRRIGEAWRNNAKEV